MPLSIIHVGARASLRSQGGIRLKVRRRGCLSPQIFQNRKSQNRSLSRYRSFDRASRGSPYLLGIPSTAYPENCLAGSSRRIFERRVRSREKQETGISRGLTVGGYVSRVFTFSLSAIGNANFLAMWTSSRRARCRQLLELAGGAFQRVMFHIR